MTSQENSKIRGFNLIELIIVVVLIGIIAAIAIPRLSRGSSGSADSALSGNLAVLRSAIDLYSREHNGAYPALATFDAQLTQYTDPAGAISPEKTETTIFGPYLRKIPALPVGANKGNSSVIDTNSATVGSVAGGWFYDPTRGTIQANCADSELDSAGKKYNSY